MTIHSYEQLMAWGIAEAQALAGKRIRLEEAADQRAFWADPHDYRGEWEIVGAGVVAFAEMRMHHGRGESVAAHLVGGGGVSWLAGQPVRLIEEIS